MQLFLASALLVFIAVAIAPGEGVKCYECLYPAVSACENPVGDDVETCHGDYCFNIYGMNDGRKTIQRTCSSNPSMADEDGCETSSVRGAEVTTCICKSDLCNGASLQSATAVSASFQSVSVVSMVTSLVLCAACASRWL